TLLSGLGTDFPLPLALVLHVDPNHVSLVANILSRRTRLNVKDALSADLLLPGVAYVAPPGRHLLIAPGGAVRLADTPPVRHLRPSADRLFETAARAFGPVIGVILSGTGTDGTAGAVAVKAGGGVVIAQDEQTSSFFGMPGSAIQAGAVDFVLPLDDIASKLTDLARSARA